MMSFLSGLARCPSVTVQDLAQALKAGEPVFLLDVREPDEFAFARIQGAVNIPLGKLKEEMASLPSDKRIVVVCRSGARSARAVWVLLDRGFRDVKNLDGGMIEWENLLCLEGKETR